MKLRLFVMLAMLLSGALACQLVPFQGNTTQTASSVLFQDDFSNPNSGWDRVTVENGETNYIDGAYRIYVNEPNTDVWSNPGLNFTDVRVEVEGAKVSGDNDNDFGIACRMNAPDNFYFFIISSDGYYAIGKYKGNQQELLGTDAMQPSETIKQDEATNHIRADCVGDTLTLYVNGQKLSETHDDEFKSGDVGLIAGSFEKPGTDIHFDNFTVLKP